MENKEKEITYKFEQVNEYKHLLACWLKPYTDEIINYILSKKDEILNDKETLHLLRELYKRTIQEENDFIDEMGHQIAYEDWTKFSRSTSTIFSHSNSYRDVLYDMYIQCMPRKKDE